MVRGLRDNKPTVRANGVGPALKPSSGLVMALDKKDCGQASWPATTSLAAPLGVPPGSEG
jgi:hypothetical protein